MTTSPPSERVYYTYALFRPDSGRVFYIGFGKGKRAWDHERLRKRRRSYKDNIICRAIDDLGYHEIPIAKIHTELTLDQAREYEVSLIQAIGRWPDGPLANIVRGGEGLSNPTQIFRLKHGKIMRAALSDPEIRKVMSAKAVARDRTGESERHRRARMSDADVRERMSVSAKARIRDPEAEARRIAKLRSPEVRKKRSEARKGKPSPWKGRSPSPETREKMRIARLGKIPWNKGLKGVTTAWNKGLTKDTSPSVDAISQKAKGNKRGLGMGHTRKGRTAWNKGLRKRAISQDAQGELKL